MTWHFLAVKKKKMLNAFPGQREIISRSSLGDMGRSAECWEAEGEGNAWFHLASLKKSARQEADVDLRLNIFEPKWEPDRKSCCDLLFLAVKHRKVRRGRGVKEGQSRVEQGRRAKGEEAGAQGCFSRGLPRKKKLGKTSPSGPKHKLPTPTQLQRTWKQHVH